MQYKSSRKEDELYHHGILGQKWGIRRFQNPDGSLTEEGRKRYGYNSITGEFNKEKYISDIKKDRAQKSKQDVRWAKKNEKSITYKAQKLVKKDIKEYDRELSKQVNRYNKSGSKNAYWQVMHNRALAELMNEKVSDIRSPNGQTIKFVAKRGSEGVYMALATEGYDISKLKNGVKSSGKVAYRKEQVNWT